MDQMTLPYDSLDLNTGRLTTAVEFRANPKTTELLMGHVENLEKQIDQTVILSKRRVFMVPGHACYNEMVLESFEIKVFAKSLGDSVFFIGSLILALAAHGWRVPAVYMDEIDHGEITVVAKLSVA